MRNWVKTLACLAVVFAGLGCQGEASKTEAEQKPDRPKQVEKSDAKPREVIARRPASLIQDYVPPETFAAVLLNREALNASTGVKSAVLEALATTRLGRWGFDIKSIEEALCLGIAGKYRIKHRENQPPSLIIYPCFATVVRFAKPIPADKVQQLLRKEAEEAKVGDKTFYIAGRSLESPAVCLIDNRTIAIGHHLAVLPIVMAGQKESEFKTTLKDKTTFGDLTMLFLADPIRGWISDHFKLHAPLPAYQELWSIPNRLHSATLTLDLAPAAKTRLTLRGRKPEDVADLVNLDEKVLGTFSQALERLEERRYSLLKPGQAKAGLEGLGRLKAALAELKPISAEHGVTVTLSSEGTSALLAGFVLPGLERIPVLDRGRKEYRQFLLLALGLSNYYDWVKGIPPAAIYSESGKPLLSCASPCCPLSTRASFTENSIWTNRGTVPITSSSSIKCPQCIGRLQADPHRGRRI